jgi:hypothetical protein
MKFVCSMVYTQKKVYTIVYTPKRYINGIYPKTMVYTMVHVMVYTTYRKPGPIVAQGYIYHGINQFFGIYYGIYHGKAFIYHGKYGIDLSLPHGIYLYWGYMALYVSI